MRRVSAFLLATAAVMASVAPSYSRTENVLYDFDSAKTGFPDGNLLRERSGALVGTAGGYGYGAPYGQVFMLGKSGKSWNLENLVRFNGQNGATPIGGLIEVSPGIYYGTTAKGGAYGAGTVFQLVHSGGSWAETVLQSFQADADDRHPQGRLAVLKGSLFGTNAGGKGAIFELKGDGKTWYPSVLHVFDGRDGTKPVSGLMRDPATGVFYGTALAGGTSGCGTAFALSATVDHWRVRSIHDFSCGADGASPQSGLKEDASGALYGTTAAGGSANCGYNGGGCGTLFRLAQGKSGWRYTVVHTFAGGDGAYPQNHDGLAIDKSGTIYGTASEGGAYNRGVVFRISGSPNGYTILHSFGGVGDGEYPSGGIIEDDGSGTLYGTTYSGGAYGYGAIYQVTQ